MRYTSGCRKGCGGARTVKGRNRAMENLKKGPEALVTHGVWSMKATGNAPRCDERCPMREWCCERAEGGACAVVVREWENAVSSCQSMTHIRAQHMPMVNQYGLTYGMIARYDIYIAAHDMVQVTAGNKGTGTVDVQPLVTARTRLVSQLVTLAGELLITPAAEARMKSASAETAREVLAGIVGAAMASGEVERAAKALGIEDGNSEG